MRVRDSVVVDLSNFEVLHAVEGPQGIMAVLGVYPGADAVSQVIAWCNNDVGSAAIIDRVCEAVADGRRRVDVRDCTVLPVQSIIDEFNKKYGKS